MDKQWITISEAVALTRKAEMTIRRFVSRHKTDIKSVIKNNGKYYINTEELQKTYHFIKTEQKSNSKTEIKHKKEAMQIAYNSEIIKNKNEYLQVKDRQIELLINKKSILPLYITIGFIILILAFSCLIFSLFTGYKKELLNNQKNKITDLKEQHAKLDSSYQKIITLQDKQIIDLSNSLNTKDKKNESWW